MCAPWSAPVPWNGHRRPETFDAYYVETRTRLLHEAYALTGDAPAARAAVRDGFVVAWHHWRKVALCSTTATPTSARSPSGRARRRHTARIWHRDKSLDAEARRHPRRPVEADRAAARAARAQRPLRPLPRRARPARSACPAATPSASCRRRARSSRCTGTCRPPRCRGCSTTSRAAGGDPLAPRDRRTSLQARRDGARTP